ncbi:MAG: ABC transporter ATP-binding protein [Pseudomonadota bacterium]
MTDRLISLRSVEKYYESYHALRGISLDIRSGEFFSLLGPSGCGKTTLLRAIAGFETLSSGELLIDGTDMVGVPANRRPTNMVFQSYAIFPHLSVAENVGFGLRRTSQTQAERMRAVCAALEMVGLEGFGGRAAHAISGGQRQRVALARALILEPKVLLLDEPLSALDKKMREQMQAELRRLQRQVGITFILVTHDQEEALIMSDRIAIMFDGEIAQVDPPATLYHRPASRRVAEFVGMMNFLPAEIKAQDDQGATVDVAGLGQVKLSDDQIIGNGPGAEIGVRPETMSLLSGEAPPDGSRVMSGKVDDRAYYGDMSFYQVAIEGTDQTLTVSMKNVMGGELLNPGAPASVAWDPRALLLFRA